MCPSYFLYDVELASLITATLLPPDGSISKTHGILAGISGFVKASFDRLGCQQGFVVITTDKPTEAGYSIFETAFGSRLTGGHEPGAQ